MSLSLSLFFQDREEQVRLENLHRAEEDRLYKQFIEHREKEQSKVINGIQEEWEVELEKLTAKFEKELSRKSKSKTDFKVLTLKHTKEKEDFEKNMTIKREKKKEHVTKKLLEQERAATAALVEKHSKEMMNLIQEKRTAFVNGGSENEFEEAGISTYPSQPPPPIPPAYAKTEIYNDPHVFAEVDQRAINVAQEDQKTFTDLVRQLVAECLSDVEKARAIFR